MSKGPEVVSFGKINPRPEVGGPVNIYTDFGDIPLPEGCLPDELEAFVLANGDFDKGALATSLLGALSGLVRPEVKIKVNETYSEQCILWVAVVARSGSRKTALLKSATSVIFALEAEEWRARELLVTAALEALPEGAGDKERKKAEADVPPAKRWSISDATVEAVGQKLQENPHGLTLIKDEISGWILNFNAYKGGKGGDRAFYLEAHDGGRLTVDRVNRPSLSIAHAKISVVGGLQEDKLSSLVAADSDDDGFWQRFFYATTGPRAFEPMKAEVSKPPNLVPLGKRLVRANRTYTVRQAELDLLNAFEERMYPLTQMPGKFGGWMRKARKHLLRLSLLFHLIIAEDYADIVQSAVKMAIRYFEHYAMPAARAALDAAEGATREDVRRLGDVILKWEAKGKREFLISDIVNGSRVGRGRTVEDIKPLLSVLIASGWVEVAKDHFGRVMSHGTKYSITSGLSTAFRERHEAAVKIEGQILAALGGLKVVE